MLYKNYDLALENCGGLEAISLIARHWDTADELENKSIVGESRV